jgi:hypothetical protein
MTSVWLARIDAGLSHEPPNEMRRRTTMLGGAGFRNTNGPHK